MLILRHSQSGMSLIELLIGLAIFGILITKGLPSYSLWIQNTQIRATAESIQAGLHAARSEAVTRNGIVEFVFTDTAPTEANVNALVESVSGRN
ncbi:MAG: pilus assembly FimT family protein, partial [Burkholderiales bacterium]